MNRGLVWFRNNLRIADNEPFWRAVVENDEILPVFIFEDNYWQLDAYGNPRTGAPRTKFLLETVQNLKANLQKLGGNLLVLRGDAKQLLPDLVQKHQIDWVYTEQSFAFDERQLEASLQNSIPVKWFWTSSLIHPEDLPFALEKLPNVFTAFRQKIEKYAQVRPAFEIPTTVKLCHAEYNDKVNWPSWGDYVCDTRAVLNFLGGETEAQKRLQHYFWESQSISSYKETRNGLLGADYSSKFSPWLANGSLSPRTIYWELKKYETKHGANESTYWLFFELLWRDFFRFVALKFDKKLFLAGGIKTEALRQNFSKKAYHKWKTGQTGEPFVDANMRELLHTGFMSNRGRQNVASYWVHNLKQYWRVGAAWFESQLIDYDPASNYGNWQYVAGVGNDPRPNRIFNMTRQAEMYDPDGLYQRFWLKK